MASEAAAGGAAAQAALPAWATAKTAAAAGAAADGPGALAAAGAGAAAAVAGTVAWRRRRQLRAWPQAAPRACRPARCEPCQAPDRLCASLGVQSARDL